MPVVAFAQDDPTEAARMLLENQALQQSPQTTVEPQSFGGNPSAQIEPSAGLTPSMGIVPDNPITTDNTNGNGIGLTPNMGIVPGPSNGGQPQQGGRGRGDPRIANPREDFLRHPDPNYRNRGPRVDDNDHDHDRDRRRPKRPPVVVVRPYYFPPPLPYYYDNLPPWSGPITTTVVWDLFSRDVYYSLPPNARWRHEQTFLEALSAPMGRTQSWRIGDVRGDVTVIDQGYYGRRFCRDFVQTIRSPAWRRTVDGRACIVRGDSWRLVDY